MGQRMVPPDYFVSPAPTLWTIDETGEALEWKDSHSTALMLPHVNLLCRALAEQLKGLPSLTAILFTVDALSKGWSLQLAEQRVERLVTSSGDLRSSRFMLPQMGKWLHSLQSLDIEFRQGVAAHTAFLCELFEQFPREWLETDEVETSQTLQWLDNILGDRGNLLATHLKDEADSVARALAALDFLSMQVLTTESLQLRMRTGLDNLPSGEPLEMVERFPIAALVRQLASLDDDLSVVARMAQFVSATVSLPRSPSDPDTLPIGGVSDVTNRGEPDRLLMSELALDSDLLIARIANGQALYLRREQPPQPESKHRCLMIETGIRTWGTMRLYAAAFALGLCIAQERRGGEQVDVVTVAGESAWLEDVTTRAGLMRFYERLLADVHPGRALMDIVNRNNLGLDMTNQPILVLSEATDRDAAFHHAINDFPNPYMVARVERTGWVDLSERSSVGGQSLQRMRLEIMAQPAEKSIKESKSTSLIVSGQKNLPGFLQLNPCPLRFSIQLDGPRVQAYKTDPHVEYWALTHDRRVMLLDDSHLGAIEVGSVPSGRVLASHVPKHNAWLLVIESTPHMSKVPVHWLVKAEGTRGVTMYQLKLGDERAHQVTYCFHHSHLLRVGKNLTYFDARNGNQLVSDPCQYPYLGQQYFGTYGVYVVDCRDDSMQWHWLGKVPSIAGSAARSQRGLPVVYARDLSWMLELTGDSPSPQPTGMKIQTGYPHSIVSVNDSGTEMLVALTGVESSTNPLLICSPREKRVVRLSLTEPKVVFAGDKSPDRLAAFQVGQHALFHQSRNMRKRITGLSFQNGRVIAHTRGKRYAIQPDKVNDVEGLFWRQVTNLEPKSRQYVFEKPIQRAGGPHARWKLRYVKLPKGEAWLDSRGMLHLKAIDGSELSLMLADSPLAGWHSSGKVFGPQYFIVDKQVSRDTLPEIVDWLTNFTMMQL